MRSKGVWLFPLLSCFPEEAKVCSNLMLLCLVLKLDDRDLGPRGRWPNYAKRVNGDKLGVLGLKWEIGWNSLYLGFQPPGGGHYWDSMHFRNIWVLTFSWTEKGSGRKSKQHRAMSGLLVMVSVMDSEPGWWTGRWLPMLPAWHRHQLGDMLQDIPVPLPARKSFTSDYEYGSLHRLFLIINHFSHFFSWFPSSCPAASSQAALCLRGWSFSSP